MSLVQITNTEIFNFEGALRGMRAPMKSYHKADSYWDDDNKNYIVGPNDYKLAMSLCHAGSREHCKFLRQIIVSCDVCLPRAIHQELDTYQIGTSKNSESTIHKLKDEHLNNTNVQFDWGIDQDADAAFNDYLFAINSIILRMNDCKQDKTENGQFWYKKYLHLVKMMLPEGFMQTRTYVFNYETLSNIYRQRKNHLMPEWQEFCNWIETLPYSEFITGKKADD